MMELYPDDEREPIEYVNSAAGQPPGFAPAEQSQPMCDECAHYDAPGRKCQKFNVEASPFYTCRAHTPVGERKLDPNMLQMGMPQGGPMSGGGGPMPGM